MEFLDTMLWVSVLFLVAGAVLPAKGGRYAAALGWAIFGLRWGLATPGFYFHEHNIMYTVACLLAIPATFYAACILVRYGRASLMALTRAAAICGIFYFPFAYFDGLSHWLIGVTTEITLACVNALGYPAVRTAFDIISLHGHLVQIILACTAVQSMAIFVGVVFAIRVEPRRQLLAFLASVPLIYILNLVRNTFVIAAYGNQWFQIMPDQIVAWTGEPPAYASFFWAHNVLAETGSLIALVLISYAVMTLMPELLDYLMDILRLAKPENARRMLAGQEVPAVPLQGTRKA